MVVAIALGASDARAATRSCGWRIVGSSTQVNALFPDSAATYWVANLPIPAGGYIEVDGQFPHARYTSLVTFTGQQQSIDGLHDAQIVPDPGSTNPFLPHADRTAAKRDYTVRIVAAQVPAGERAPNTIYTTSADGSKSGGAATQRFTLRIYEGDKGTGLAGGVPLPDITLVTATGQRITLPQCPDEMLPDTGLTAALAGAGPDSTAVQALPIAGKTGFFGTNPPVWHKFTNTATSVVTVNTNNAQLAEQTDALLPPGGFGDNPDNKYVYTTYQAEFGQVLTFTAKAPTFPETRDGQKRMGSGQLRYWSFCTNAQTTAVYACAQDDEIPVDKDDEYTIAISTKAARPRNATKACGVTWLPAGAVPQSILILRNMLPDASFAQAIQRVVPGKEAQTMGAYYPRGRYYATKAAFERRGCPR